MECIMDLVYLKEHLCEELEGAKEYIKRAIEIKAMDSNWGKLFYEMSVQELSHAENFFKMSQFYYSKVTSVFKEKPDYMDECMYDITEMYTEETTAIKAMQELYSR